MAAHLDCFRFLTRANRNAVRRGYRGDRRPGTLVGGRPVDRSDKMSKRDARRRADWRILCLLDDQLEQAGYGAEVSPGNPTGVPGGVR
jgi:hypothetical protein